AAPNLNGSVIVDLKRMNRILRVDDERNFALVEPGVTYFDLYRYIQERGLKVWIDCADVGWGGLVGNALDRRFMAPAGEPGHPVDGCMVARQHALAGESGRSEEHTSELQSRENL